ncbi:hypothetical protein BDZ94DRAFT_1265750 [Collybia nuda]|uniref:N-acetyltransferase domain-containing protein n=1 Tax=Collybia nuda TaxID=64659 RepID=A0A9P6CCD5_9AGAR|nr:hypothetical protein BDZ94DRAFT_1265750 [Collybia nuda]
MSLVPLELGANVRAATLGGEIYVATIGPEPEDIVGAAIWYAPGQSSMSTDEQRAAGWDQFLSVIPEELKSWWMEHFIPEIGRLADEALGPGYKLKSWHLHLFGVVPTYQRRGLGKALMRVVDDLAKADGAPIVLETTTEIDVLIYKKLGFDIKGETTIKSSLGVSPLYIMAKEP